VIFADSSTGVFPVISRQNMQKITPFRTYDVIKYQKFARNIY